MMNLPNVLAVLRCLVADTFRQARASGVLWLMLVISGLCVLFCLSVEVTGGTTIYQPGETREFVPAGDPAAQDPTMLRRHGVDAPRGEVRLLFGAFRIPYQRYREEPVHFLELLLAGWLADTAGMILILVWTAGFLPTFLEGQRVSVLLAKPAPRWLLLVGKYLAVVVFVACQATLFVAGTWLALGLKTGVWDGRYLLCLPLLVLQFAVFFSVSLLLALPLRNTVACVFGSVLFWFVCWGGNYGRNLAALGTQTGPWRWCGEVAYWLLPKPADLGMILFDALHAEGYFGRPLDVKALVASGAFVPELSVLTSLLFAAAVLWLSAYRFERTDY
jgi:hypothetical protein